MEHQQNQREWAGYGQTEPGLVRTTNQDSFLVDNRRRLWAVADGMGGHPGGEVASRLVVDILADFRGIRLSEGRADVTGRPIETDQALGVFHILSPALQRTRLQIRVHPGDGGTHRTRQQRPRRGGYARRQGSHNSIEVPRRPRPRVGCT